MWAIRESWLVLVPPSSWEERVCITIQFIQLCMLRPPVTTRPKDPRNLYYTEIILIIWQLQRSPPRITDHLYDPINSPKIEGINFSNITSFPACYDFFKKNLQSGKVFFTWLNIRRQGKSPNLIRTWHILYIASKGNAVCTTAYCCLCLDQIPVWNGTRINNVRTRVSK